MKILSFLMLLFLTLPGLAQEEEADIEKLNEHRKNHQELVEKITRGVEKKDEPSDLPPELQKLGYKSLDIVAFQDERVVRYFQKILRQNPMGQVPRQEVEKLILERTRDSIINPFLVSSPALLACLADILKDGNAMASALGIFLRQGSLKLYAVIWIIFMIMTWLLKRIVLNDDWGKWKLRMIGLIVSLTMTGVSLSTFYLIFEKELSPTITIISRHL